MRSYKITLPSFKYIAIGDELLNGSRLNKNALTLGKLLNENGFRLNKITIIADSIKNIAGEINESFEDVIITSGGLGPTDDDKTIDALCFLLNCPKVIHPPSLRQIETKIADENTLKRVKKQAYYPEKADAIFNHFGLAPIIEFKWNKKQVFCLPGVPVEFNGMLRKQVLSTLLKTYQKNQFYRFNVYLHGVAESKLNVHLESTKEFSHLNFSYLPYLGGVNLIAESNEIHQPALLKLNSFIKQHYHQEVISLEGKSLLDWIHHHFSQNNLKLGVCESCTGGLIINSLIQRPGSSNYIDVGIVTYSNESKADLLNIDQKLIKKEGAVSQSVCEAMLMGLVKRRSLEAAISTTGVAGPGGGTQNKPVGLIYIGVYYKKQKKIKRYQFNGDRESIQQRTMWSALNDLRLLIKNKA